MFVLQRLRAKNVIGPHHPTTKNKFFIGICEGRYAHSFFLICLFYFRVPVFSFLILLKYIQYISFFFLLLNMPFLGNTCGSFYFFYNTFCIYVFFSFFLFFLICLFQGVPVVCFTFFIIYFVLCFSPFLLFPVIFFSSSFLYAFRVFFFLPLKESIYVFLIFPSPFVRYMWC